MLDVLILIFLVFVVISGVALFYMSIEAKRLKIERSTIKHEESKNRVKNIKIVHLSDIHIRFMKVKIEKIKSLLNSENPDFIFLTGDYIEFLSDIPKFLSFIDKALCGREFYFVFGNHDYIAFKKGKKNIKRFANEISKRGGIFLENESINFKMNDLDINIIGIGDIRYKCDNVKKAFRKVKRQQYNIVLSHNPDLALKLKNLGVNLFLCGHFHGGQIRVPFRFEFYILRSEKLCKMGYINGKYSYEDMEIYINRGLGNVCFPLRFLSRPEFAIIEI